MSKWSKKMVLIPAVAVFVLSLGCLTIVAVGQAGDGSAKLESSSQATADRESNGDHAEGGEALPEVPVRSVKIKPEKEKTSISISVQPHEFALMAYADGTGGPAYPFLGVQFPADTDRLELLAEIRKPIPAKKWTWSFMIGMSEIGERAAMAGGRIRPEPKGEKPLEIGHMVVPTGAKDVELHLFPFIIVNGRVGSMMVVIGKNRDAIRDAVRFQESRDFNWESGFRDVSKFFPDWK